MEEDVYIIPHNYTDNGKILGMFEKESAYLAIAWVVPMTLLEFNFLPFSVDIKIFVLILGVIPPAIFALIGIGGETLISFVKCVHRFYSRARIYFYMK